MVSNSRTGQKKKPTLSKALKDAPDIKTSTKDRVKLIAKEIGYQPDRAGQRLRTGKTNVIALVINTDASLFSMPSDFINGVNEALRNTDYHVVLAPYLHEDDPMKSVRQLVETQAADGLILSCYTDWELKRSVSCCLPLSIPMRSLCRMVFVRGLKLPECKAL